MDDLCLDKSDENCEKTIWPIFLLAEICLFFAVIGLCAVIIWSCDSLNHHGQDLELSTRYKTDFLDSIIMLLMKEDEDVTRVQGLYRQYHDKNENYLDFFTYLQFSLKNEDYATKVRAFQGWLALEVLTHSMNTLKADHCLKQRLGTNYDAMQFYDFAYPGIVKKLLASLFPKIAKHMMLRICPCSKLIQLLENAVAFPAKKWNIAGKYLLVTSIKIIIVHADIVKDLLLIYALLKIISVDSPAFGQHILGVLIGSIMATELLNLMMTIAFLKSENLATSVKLTASLLSPLMPAVAIVMKSWWDYKLDVLSSESCTEFLIKRNTFKKNQVKWEKLFVAYKQNEISTEHFPQLVILVFLILLSRSESASVDGLQAIFAGRSNITFVLISTAISFTTLLRTMLQKSVSAKNNFLPVVGKMLLAVSFVIGTASRFFAVILYFAPSLGLISLNMHWKMGHIH